MGNLRADHLTLPDGTTVTYDHQPVTDQSFDEALDRARQGRRLTVADGIELLTTGTSQPGIDPSRKQQVTTLADRRRAEEVGEEVTFVVNLNNNISTVCDVGCLFCNFNTPSSAADDGGYTRSPGQSRNLVRDAVDRGISEVTTVSGLHPALALDNEHRERLDTGSVTYHDPGRYPTDPGTYVEQIEAMSVADVHVHGITPEEAVHARRGTDWTFEDVYTRLAAAGLNSVPGTAAEILVDEVRELICPHKVTTDQWIEAIEAAAAVGLDCTATIMYGHIENAAHRIRHLESIRALQDRTGAIREFVPLSFVHQETPLYKQGYVDGGASTDEDELMVAVSRLFLDNIDHIQASWVKHGDQGGLRLLNCGADDFMGTILSEEITRRAGGEHGEFRSVSDYIDLIRSIDRVPVERSTDYRTQRQADRGDPPHGPLIGPRADGTPLFPSDHQ